MGDETGYAGGSGQRRSVAYMEVGCTHFAMESTGVYWKPVFNIVESVCEVLLVNARDVKALPGRKTDVRDCEWLSELLEAGLLKSSFIPPAAFRELRDLTRYRKTLIQTRASEANRIQKLLETANIKLASVATDILGASGRAMLRALIAGERDEARLAEMAKGSLRNKRDQLLEALSGRFTGHHAFLLSQLLSHLEELDQHIAACDDCIEEKLRPFERELTLVRTITGVGHRTGEVILAEARQQRERWQTEDWKDAKGQYLAQGSADRSCLVRQSYTRYLPEQPLPSHRTSTRRQESRGRRRSCDRHFRLAYPQQA
jgi:transposase